MGFGMGTLLTGGNLQGGVHKIQIFIRKLLAQFLRNFLGEEIGGGQGHPDPLMKKGSAGL